MDVIKAFDTLALGFKKPEINNNVHTRIKKEKNKQQDFGQFRCYHGVSRLISDIFLWSFIRKLWVQDNLDISIPLNY